MLEKELPENLYGTHIHMVGIKGTGMAALTEILTAQGATITGSDVSERFYTDDILEKLNIVVKPFREENISEDVALVIYSAAYNTQTNPDLIAAHKKNIPLMLYTEALGAISKKCYGCAISGVHGKTSTTGLVGTILAETDLNAQVLAGSVITSFGNSCTMTTKNFTSRNNTDNAASVNANDTTSIGTSETSNDVSISTNIFAAETCEYQRHFLSFSPQIIIITSVESDHQDYYPTYESMRDAFVEFADKLPKGGKLIYCADDKGAAEVADIMRQKRCDIKRIPYGENAENSDGAYHAYCLTFGKISDGQQSFSVSMTSIANTSAGDSAAASPDEFSEAQFSLRVPGKHEVRDAVAAIALVYELLLERKKIYGCTNSTDSGTTHKDGTAHGNSANCNSQSDYIERIRKGLFKFSGGKRRSELIGHGNIADNSVIVIDDYAHHPTAIKTTLAGFREFFPRRKIIVDFMSHTYSRTAALLDEFASSFESADIVILHKIYASAREDSSKANIDGKTLFEKAKNSGNNAFYFEEPLDCIDFVVDLLSKKCDDNFSDGYLFVTMGAGDNWKVGKEICSKFASQT